MSSEPQLERDDLAPNARSGVATLLFTDIVGSTALKQRLGDKAGLHLLQRHHQLLRQLLGGFPGAREINTAGDSFFLAFPMPSTAVSFALRLQTRLRDFNRHNPSPIDDRVGIHLGEVAFEGGEQHVDLHGLSVDVCARVMSLAQAGQILVTRWVFDNARQSLKGEEIEGRLVELWNLAIGERLGDGHGDAAVGQARPGPGSYNRRFRRCMGRQGKLMAWREKRAVHVLSQLTDDFLGDQRSSRCGDTHGPGGPDLGPGLH